MGHAAAKISDCSRDFPAAANTAARCEIECKNTGFQFSAGSLLLISGLYSCVWAPAVGTFRLRQQALSVAGYGGRKAVIELSPGDVPARKQKDGSF
jgi:hypothetical protein